MQEESARKKFDALDKGKDGLLDLVDLRPVYHVSPEGHRRLMLRTNENLKHGAE